MVSLGSQVLAPSPVLPTLSDPEAQRHFTRDGIVVVPLLDPDEAAKLRREILAILPPQPWDFFDFFRNNPPALRREVDQLIRSGIEEKASELFVDHDFWAASVLAKPPGPKGEINLHTDWNMVDEARYRSGLIWVALEDMTEGNGAISVVPGTNRLDVSYRGFGIHYPYDDPAVREQIDARAVQIAVPTGHAAIWDNRLLHGSGPNNTEHVRLAAGLGFRPREAQLYHYRQSPDGTSHRYAIEREFFLDYLPFTDLDEISGPHVLEDTVHPVPTWAPTVDDLIGLGEVQPILGNVTPRRGLLDRFLRRRNRSS